MGNPNDIEEATRSDASEVARDHASSPQQRETLAARIAEVAERVAKRKQENWRADPPSLRRPRAVEELHGAILFRQRLIERAKRHLYDNDVALAVDALVDVLEHVQAHDEGLLQLHAECHGLIEHCRKVLEGEMLRRPVVFGAVVPTAPAANEQRETLEGSVADEAPPCHGRENCADAERALVEQRDALRAENASLLAGLNVKERERREHRDAMQAWADSYAVEVDGAERDVKLWEACTQTFMMRVPLAGRRGDAADIDDRAAPKAPAICLNCGQSEAELNGRACSSGGGPQHDWERHEVDGPPIKWTPNADAGDSTPTCKLCGREQDEPHTWRACAEYLVSQRVVEFDWGWKGAEDHAKALAAEAAAPESLAVAALQTWANRYARERPAKHNAKGRDTVLFGACVALGVHVSLAVPGVSIATVYGDGPATRGGDMLPVPYVPGVTVLSSASSDVPSVTAENAREILGDELGDHVAEALSPGGALDVAPPVVVHVDREIAGVDLGVRSLVAWLNLRGFKTTDSGDGVSKADVIAEGEALPVAHVHMRVGALDLLNESQRLMTLLDEIGVTVDPGTIQATYDPADGIAVLTLSGVDDGAAKFNTKAKEITP